ncbi:MAG: hypothetical protein H7318_10460 [Oligoflexus sp.]|nr:hypothetical protein [Oligoflexus sp.]
MDHRKVSLDPEDLKKLMALLQEEEARVDALSDSDLKADEEALEGRIRDFARGHSEGNTATDSINTNWQKIQPRMAAEIPSEQSSPKEEKEGRVIAFQPKKKTFPWTTMGAVAAAALALLVLYPKLAPTGGNDPGDLSQMQTKGANSGGSYASFCDVDLRGQSKTSVEELGNGMGYFAKPGESFEISLLCDADGYVQLWTAGAPATEFRNIKVQRNERIAITQSEGKAVSFNLQGRPEMNYGVALTDKPIDNDVNLLESSIPATSLGKGSVLWSDNILVKGK